MNRAYKNIMHEIGRRTPPAGLEGLVLSTIEQHAKRFLVLRVVSFVVSTAVSFAGIAWSFIYLLQSFGQSGFNQYLSLIFSDKGAMLTYWNELASSLVESLPLMTLITFLIISSAFTWLLGKTIESLRQLSSYKHYLPA